MDRATVERALRALGEIGAARQSVVQTSTAPTDSQPPLARLTGERRFAQPHERLFPFLGRKVRTPAGPGTLLQVLADRVTVLLDSELARCSFFAPGQIEPLHWEARRSE